MEAIFDLPVWLLALIIFTLRVIDVSIGTCRTIAVVQGRMATSVVLGFVEVLVWVTTVAQVIAHASSNPWLLLAYAAGFAAGNATGIFLERRLAMGMVILRIITSDHGRELAEALHESAPSVYMFDGYYHGDQITLVYVAVRRRAAPRLIKRALGIDPQLFYAVDTLRESNLAMYTPLPPVNGLRTHMKTK